MKALAIILVLVAASTAGCTDGPAKGDDSSTTTATGPTSSAEPRPWTVAIAGPGNATVGRAATLVVQAEPGDEAATVLARVLAGPDVAEQWSGAGPHVFTPAVPGTYTLEVTAVAADGVTLAQGASTLAVTYQDATHVSCRGAINGGLLGDPCPGHSVQLGNMSVHFRATVIPPVSQTATCGSVALYHDGVEHGRTSVMLQDHIEVNYLLTTGGNWTIDWEPTATAIVLQVDYDVLVRPWDGVAVAPNVENC